MTPAREWWEAVRRSARALEPTLRELDALTDADEDCLSWYPSGGGMARGGISDPTAQMALRRAHDLDRAIMETQARLDELELLVGHALRLLATTITVRVSERAASAMELYYVDLADTWTEVAEALGVSRETIRADRDAVLTYCDSRPDLLC